MYPIICKIGPVNVYSYGLMLVIAFITGSSLLLGQAKKAGFNPDTIFNLVFISFICGIIGGRIFYVLENLDFYSRNAWEIIMLQRGGLSWFGGLIAGIISANLYLKKKKLSVYKVLDLIAPYLALTQAIGRIGCLLNGCCFGKPEKFGIYFPVHDAVLIPAQLYSSVILILIFIILRFLQEASNRDGQIFFTYLLLYSLKRFFIEFLRLDNPVIFFGLTLFQLISLAIFFFSIFKLTSIIKLKK